ncbi:hypothetical protein KBB12_01855 [Candidatus Woesebacteria bacterium]|nr:hypothetical protein [Candidatus Woesebacteria bacterium]
MSTLVIGSGLAGLITVIHTKTGKPGEDVLMVEKPFPEGNTLIAGQRIRAGVAGKRIMPVDEIMSLLTRRNNGKITRQMGVFAETLIREISYWHKCEVPHSDNPLWFGPQWGKPELHGVSKSHSLIEWFRNKASDLGVIFRSLEVIKLYREDSLITGVLAKDANSKLFVLKADNYVLAGGSSTGLLFESTNRVIHYPPQLLAHDVGIPLSGSTVTMTHPFGFCSRDLRSIPGCYETDAIAQHQVYDTNENRLYDVEDLLQRHKAHYHFPKISSDFWKIGGNISLVSSDKTVKKTRVSVHYNQLGIQTTDGVCVNNINNLYAVGDASGLNYWTNHTERFPGFAIGNCLVSGRMCANAIYAKSRKSNPILLDVTVNQSNDASCNLNSHILHKLRRVNAEHILNILLLENNSKTYSTKWEQEMTTACHSKSIQDMSILF